MSDSEAARAGVSSVRGELNAGLKGQHHAREGGIELISGHTAAAFAGSMMSARFGDQRSTTTK